MSLLFRASTRHLLHHRLQCALALGGIALGVAIVISIQVTQLSARNAFDASLAGVIGSATHEVTAVRGFLGEHHYATLRKIAPHWRPQPLVSGRVRLNVNDDVAVLHLLGVDPLTLPRRALGVSTEPAALIRTPATVLMNNRTARRLGLGPGDQFTVRARGEAKTLRVLDILPAVTAPGLLLADNVLVADIATAQETLAMHGKLSRIELDDTDVNDPAAARAALEAALGPDVLVRSNARNRASAQQMTRAFYTNLDALSLLALLVGAFMIYNTMSFLVIQRQDLYARLRALGFSRSAVALQVAGEAALLGALGGVIGSALGYGLAHALMQPLAQTLDDHYAGGAPTVPDANLALMFAGLALAILTSVLASLPPALQAAGTTPAASARASHRERQAHTALVWCERAGVVLLLAAVLLIAFSARSLYAGFAALGCVLLAATLASPRLLQRLLDGADYLFAARLALPERLALRGAARSLHRLGMAVAALMAATATSVGVALMVDSFRGSVSDWLQQLLRADLFIVQIEDTNARAAITPSMMQRLLVDPRVITLSKVRRQQIEVGDGTVQLTAYALPPPARQGFRFVAGDAASVWSRWDSPDTALVSEPYAWHHDVKPGDRVVLPTPAGRVEFTIVGVYTDYGSERGVVAVSWANYTRYWGAQDVHSVGLYTTPGTDLEPMQRELTTRYADNSDLLVWTGADIQRQSLAVFDRTFAITGVLTLLAALIAALGVFNALLALNLERAREFAILRAAGAGPPLLRRMLYTQTILIAGFAIVLAIPLGTVIALLLTDIINVRSFGWSMELSWHTRAVMLPTALALGAACVATLYPAEQAVRARPAAALRYD